MSTRSNNTFIYIMALIVATIIALAVIMHYTKRDQTFGERIDAAAGEMVNGVEKAADKFQDRSLAEKTDDAVKDVGNSIERAVE
jgi:hypothetical protein